MPLTCIRRDDGSYRPTSTYKTWDNMRQRCGNPKHIYYNLYGGRGIKICSRWDRYENFLADMGERPSDMSIDRINSDGNYEPSNCRWATALTQGRNRTFRDKAKISGENNHNAKLSFDQVRAIRKAAKARTGRSLAREYGVTPQAISLILKNKTYIEKGIA